MIVLACNAGSTSLKFKLYRMPEKEVLATGRVERVGSSDDALFSYKNLQNGYSLELSRQSIPDYGEGIRRFLACLTEGEGAALASIGEIACVAYKPVLSRGHYEVHEFDESVLGGMREFYDLAPVHTGAYLKAVETVSAALPGARHIGVFETAFHKTVPLERKLYGIPYEWYEKYGIRRMGYHGASHGYIADVLSAERRQYRAISCHLGGSGSVCAILDGHSVDTSFGMSLETGLIHANRVGDMDPTMFNFLMKQGLTEDEIMDGLLKKGGLLGISGVSNDLRYIQEAADAGNERARLALEVFVSGIVHYIGAFFVDLGGLDVLVFTAGIGEHSDRIRQMVCEKLSALGIVLDEEKNRNCCGAAVISAPESRVEVRVIPTDEELGIASRAYEYLSENQ